MLREGEMGTSEGSEEECKHSSRVSVLRGEMSAQRGVLKYQANVILFENVPRF